MVNLSEVKCVPCKASETKPLDVPAVQEYLSNLEHWEAINNSTCIRKAYRFKNFKQALKFVNYIAVIAEEEGHHPDLTFGWGYCEVCIQTHSINGLHQNDFIIATRIDAMHHEFS